MQGEGSRKQGSRATTRGKDSESASALKQMLIVITTITKAQTILHETAANVDLGEFVISSLKEDTVGIKDLEGTKDDNNFQRISSSINEI